jgi:hypothetical protein
MLSSSYKATRIGGVDKERRHWIFNNVNNSLKTQSIKQDNHYCKNEYNLGADVIATIVEL